MEANQIEKYLEKANSGIDKYLSYAFENGMIDEQLYLIAKTNTYPNLEKWVLDENIAQISPNYRTGIQKVINSENWEQIVNAYRQYLSFGTGGIRGMMAFDKESIEKMYENPGPGIDAPILKGPNTINNILLLLTSTGVAKFGKKKGYSKIVIGYDSRVRGKDFATLVAELFLGYDYQVFLFDAPCPYPEVTFAIPYESIKADIGILISASHNDYRYNGYKLSCGNGSQFDPEERDVILNEYIKPLFQNEKFSESTVQFLKKIQLKDAKKDKLWFLSGKEKLDNFNYEGFEKNRINIHDKHIEHIMTFLISKDIVKNQINVKQPLNIGYCAYHGAGNIAVPRLLKESGFQTNYIVTKNQLNELNGLFPSFPSAAGRERQPDPGDTRAAKVAVDSFKEDFPGVFDDLDILIGTDPDADRCGVVVKVPKNQQFLYDYQDWCLLPSDDLWGLILWYRLTKGKDNIKNENLQDNDKKFIVLSITTSDSIVKLALKHNIGVVKTWVGFASLSAATRDLWTGNQELYRKNIRLKEGIDPENSKLSDPIVFESYGLEKHQRIENIGAMEQSNGFSILGKPPKDNKSLGEGGHVRDKDGTFAAFLVAELAAYAKNNNTSLYELLDEKIYLDPQIGLFVNGYEPDPLDGEYPGIIGDRIKKNILRRTYGLFHKAMAGDLIIAGMKVKTANIYRTGKYDHVYPPSMDFQFPDEGIRFYFDEAKLNFVIIRPSGTGNSLRFHTQLHAMINEENLDINIDINKEKLMKKLILKKEELKIKTEEIFSDIRIQLNAPKKRMYNAVNDDND